MIQPGPADGGQDDRRRAQRAAGRRDRGELPAYAAALRTLVISPMIRAGELVTLPLMEQFAYGLDAPML